MHNEVGNMMQRLISFHYLREVSQKKIDGVFDSWLSFHEDHYRYTGCGVSSVEQLIFPAFFFSDMRFRGLIAEEEDWFSAPWLKIREHLKDFGNYFEAKNWFRIYQIISKIFDEIKKLSLYLYTTNGSFYELINIFDSEDKTAGKMGLASITANDTSHGSGWNPDAAMIMAVNDIMKGRPDKRRYSLIHISDCEFCKSLARSDLANGLEEVKLAARRIVDEGNSYVVARIGKDEDPFALSNVRHEYLYFPDGVLKEAKVDELYKALLQATKDI